MAGIDVRYRGPLRELTGIEGEAINAGTVRDVIRHIKSIHGVPAGKLAKTMLIAIDGESMLLRKGFATPLKDGETVQFLPLCGGG